MASSSADLILYIIAKDKASKTIAKTGVAIAAVTAGLVAFAKKSVEAYSESEDAVNRLTFAYKKFPKAADVSLQSMDDLSKTLQKTTVFSDEATKTSEALLLQFNLTGKQVEQLTPLIQDYAAATGQDLTSATEAVGKAFEGNARALKAVGINFKATGNTAQDFATIQADLNEKVGGFAAEQGKTAAGQAKILANQFNDLEEQVGSLLVPAMTDLLKVITPIVEAFNRLPGPVKSSALGVGLIGGAVALAIPKIVAMKKALKELGVQSGGLRKSLIGGAGLTVAFAAVAAGLDLLATKAQQAQSLTDALASGDNAARIEGIYTQLQDLPGIIDRGHTWTGLFQSIKHSSDVLNELGVSVQTVAGHLQNDGDQAWAKYEQSLLDASNAAGENSSTTDTLRTNLDKLRDAAQGAKVKTDALGTSIGDLPPKATINFFAPGLDRAVDQANTLLAQLALISAQQYRRIVGTSPGSRGGAGYTPQGTPGSIGPGGRGSPRTQSKPHRAAGGSVVAGQAYTVGEYGSETFVPLQSGTILPHGAGGTVNYITIYTTNPQDTVAAIRQYERANSSRWRAA